MNVAVMAGCFLVNPRNNNNLCDQARVIRKYEWWSPNELESIKVRLYSKTSGERRNEEEFAGIETMAVELKEENEREAEIIDQKRGERTEEKIYILNEIINSWTSGFWKKLIELVWKMNISLVISGLTSQTPTIWWMQFRSL